MCTVTYGVKTNYPVLNHTQTTEHRQFGTISVGKREDVAEVLVAEGLAETQRHRDDDEKSPRYDELCVAEVCEITVSITRF